MMMLQIKCMSNKDIVRGEDSAKDLVERDRAVKFRKWKTLPQIWSNQLWVSWSYEQVLKTGRPVTQWGGLCWKETVVCFLLLNHEISARGWKNQGPCVVALAWISYWKCDKMDYANRFSHTLSWYIRFHKKVSAFAIFWSQSCAWKVTYVALFCAWASFVHETLG